MPVAVQAKISKHFRLGTAHKVAFLHLQSYSFGLRVTESGKLSSNMITMAFLKATSVLEDYIQSSFITLVCSIDGFIENCVVDVEVILVAGGRGGGDTLQLLVRQIAFMSDLTQNSAKRMRCNASAPCLGEY